MSLKPSPVPDVSELTARIARAAFTKGNPYLRLRDELGPVFRDADFADLYPMEVSAQAGLSRNGVKFS